MSFLLEISRILILLHFCTVNSIAQSNISRTSSTCSSSSCGNISAIRYPFRLKGDPISCGYNDPYFELDCQNNQTLLTVSSRNYHVHDINYEKFSIRLADSNLNRANLSSCPGHSDRFNEWFSSIGRVRIFDRFFEVDKNHPVVFIHCVAPVSSSMYVNASFCGNRRSVFSNSSEIYSYVMAGDVRMSDLEDWCTVDRMQASTRWPMTNTSSLASIYDDLAYGFELSWHRSLCEECESVNGFCRFEGNKLSCSRTCIVDIPFLQTYPLYYDCREDISLSILGSKCQLKCWGIISGIYGAMVVGPIVALRLIVYKWRRRHLSQDQTIEDFLKGQNNLTPIKYTYSEIKKMTNNFNQKLGEGGYGTIYKGKLRSDPYIAVKMMGQSVANDEEFIGEVGTIGRNYHANIVQLVGFCVEASKCALVYEYLQNGSLDKYIFGQKDLALRYEKMFDIALGVARGIDYLHHGCDMQILHFDIKPHNI